MVLAVAVAVAVVVAAARGPGAVALGCLNGLSLPTSASWWWRAS
jgi:hypothetical protein